MGESETSCIAGSMHHPNFLKNLLFGKKCEYLATLNHNIDLNIFFWRTYSVGPTQIFCSQQKKGGVQGRHSWHSS